MDGAGATAFARGSLEIRSDGSPWIRRGITVLLACAALEAAASVAPRCSGQGLLRGGSARRQQARGGTAKAPDVAGVFHRALLSAGRVNALETT
jgi:hypothetical protein